VLDDVRSDAGAGFHFPQYTLRGWGGRSRCSIGWSGFRVPAKPALLSYFAGSSRAG
jgi:hypothetical protein